jgi:hypothetical protein
MLGEILIALAALILLCLYGSGNRTDPYKSYYYTQEEDDLYQLLRASGPTGLGCPKQPRAFQRWAWFMVLSSTP